MLPAPAPRLARLSALVLPALLVAVFVMLTSPGAAQASNYRFWNFWTAEDAETWVYSQLGPASTFPSDGAIQGWVFAATDASSPSIPPSVTPGEAFELACSDEPIDPDTKRVAIVLDSGTADIAPTGQVPPTLEVVCAVGALDASGYELLNSATTLRTENGFICAINEYPAMECSAEYEPGEVAIASTEANDTNTSTTGEPADSNALAPVSTAVVLGLVAVAGFYFWRRRTS